MILHLTKCDRKGCDFQEPSVRITFEVWHYPRHWVNYDDRWYCTPQCLFTQTGAR